MSAVNNNECNRLNKTLDIANFGVSTIEPIEKFTKALYRSIDLFLGYAGKVSTSFSMLSSRLKGSVDIIEGISIYSRVSELACPDEKGRYFFSKNTWQKCTDRVLVAVACVFKTINAGIKLCVLNLGKIASSTIGRISVFRLIPDCCIAIGSVFAIWDNKNVLKEVNADLKVASAKVEQWTNRSTLIEQVRSGNYWEIVELKTRYEGKVKKIQVEINNLDPVNDSKSIAKKMAILKKYQDRLDKIQLNDNVGLADDLAKQDINFKLKKWSIVQSNGMINKNKAWIGIANSISKIFIITYATTLGALGMLTGPYWLSVLATGIVVDSIGLTKCLYAYGAKTQRPPKESSAVV